MSTKKKKNVELELVTPFIGSEVGTKIESNSIHILGMPFDGTTSFRPGTRFGPRALRDASCGLETYSPYLDKDLTERKIIDLGNLNLYPSRYDLLMKDFEDLTKGVKLKAQHIKFLTLGGEHSISYAPLKLYLKEYKDLVVIHLDAHTDLREEFLGDKNSHACVIRRVLDLFGPKNRLIQYGIRSGTKEEFTWMKKNGTLKNSFEDLMNDLQSPELSNGRPIYLTLDLDFFDPAYLPGTGTPETGGENFHHFMSLLKVLSQKNLVGADVVELTPHLDPTGNSNCFASKVVREILLSLQF
jgi:agmatinase